MPKGSKISGVFFILILLVLSIKWGDYNVLKSQLHSSGPENPDYCSSTSKLDLFFLNHHPEERAFFSDNNLRTPVLKEHLTDTKFDPLSLEKRIFSVSSGYLSYSVRLQPSLTNVEIIYPFHSHW